MSKIEPTQDASSSNPRCSTRNSHLAASDSQQSPPLSRQPQRKVLQYSDSIHNLVDMRALDALIESTKMSEFALERVPSAHEVSIFFKELNLASNLPLASRLVSSPRDGSVSLQHQWTDGKATYKIILSTVTCDYTRRSSSRYSSRWDKVERVGEPKHIAIVCKHFDEAQKKLLEEQDPFLHQVVEHKIYDECTGTTVTTYNVETVRRYKPGRETVQLLDADIRKWKHQFAHSRSAVTPFDATIWGVLDLVETDPRHDEPRLNLIRDVIAAYLSTTVKPIELPFCINMYELLKSRYSRHRDGRARYPIVRGLAYSQSIVQPSENPLQTRNVNFYSPVTVPREMREHGKVVAIIILTLFTSSLGMLYLLRMRGLSPKEQEAVMSNALKLVFGLLSLSFISWTSILTGSFDPLFIFRRYHILNGEDLYNYTRHRTLPERLYSLAVPESVAYYNGDWINFSGEDYSGHFEYPSRFHTSQLMEAAYQTTICMDGREALLTPGLSSRVRMRGICRYGRAVFGKKEQEIDESCHVVSGARVVWRSDAEIGRSKDLL